jgi:hypothetical protein
MYVQSLLRIVQLHARLEQADEAMPARLCGGAVRLPHPPEEAENVAGFMAWSMLCDHHVLGRGGLMEEEEEEEEESNLLGNGNLRGNGSTIAHLLLRLCGRVPPSS